MAMPSPSGRTIKAKSFSPRARVDLAKPGPSTPRMPTSAPVMPRYESDQPTLW